VLLYIKAAKFFYKPWPKNKGNQQSSKDGINSPEGNIAKYVKNAVSLMKRVEQMIEHV
jgi:hypothetical protein